MPRRAKFSEADILGVTATLVARGGPPAATIGAIAQALAAPSGSIYHRFASRDELLGRLWLCKAGFFQDAFALALARPDAREAGIAAALSIPLCARADFAGARIMLLHRREDFFGPGWPAAMRDEAERLGRQADSLLAEAAGRLFGQNTSAARLNTAFALLDIPMGTVRRHLARGRPPPPEVDALIAVAAGAILDQALPEETR